jgi:hypothetical protein
VPGLADSAQDRRAAEGGGQVDDQRGKSHETACLIQLQP